MIRMSRGLILVTLVMFLIGVIGVLINEWRFAGVAILWLLIVLFVAFVEPWP
jgi:hypothetical protein